MEKAMPNDDRDARVDELFRDQHGHVSRAQAIAAGLSKQQIDYRLRTGRWTRVLPSTYRLTAAAESWEGSLIATCLHTNGVASHRCAAALWDLILYDEPPVEITVSKTTRSTHDARLHQSTQWHLRDQTTRRGVPCTGIERTLLDCAAVVSFSRFERLCEDAIRREYTSWEELALSLRRHSRQGRNGCGPMRKLLAFRLEDQTIPLSDFSRLIVQLLVENGVPKPLIEYRITDDLGALILQTDLAWPSERKAWELDGLKFHSGRLAMERDKRKRNRAKAHGWSIQEILWSMYTDAPDELVRMARAFLRS